jgi:hypothetical protein
MSRMAQAFQRQLDELRGRQPQPSRKQEKAKKDRTEAEVKTDVRAAVFALDPQCICGQCRPRDTDEMHELVPRSKTRGLPPAERFNTRNCVRLSRSCHARVTGELGKGKSMTITCMDDAKGADGALLVAKDGDLVTYRRLR